MIVLAPSSVQEMYDLTCLAFDLSDKYRNPAMILGDALIGQMKEPLVRKKCAKMDLPPKDWALTGAQGRKPNRLKSLYLQDGELSEHNWKLYQKYERMKKEEVRFETFFADDARLMVAAFGSMARVSKTSVELAREEGMKVGLFRPITLFPFPEKALYDLSQTGQIIFDGRTKYGADGGGCEAFGGTGCPGLFLWKTSRFSSFSGRSIGRD